MYLDIAVDKGWFNNPQQNSYEAAFYSDFEDLARFISILNGRGY